MNIYELLGINRQEANKILKDKSKHYITYPITKKSGKKRYINAPSDELKKLQNAVLYKFIYKYKTHPLAHGFTKYRSPVTNAKKHIKAEMLICLDIKDFFTSITELKVKKVIKLLLSNSKLGLDNINEATNVICNIITYKKVLPQGAPTSPAFSNLVCLGIDKYLSGLQKTFGCVITRYCDDIAISTESKNNNLPIIIPFITVELKKYGFNLNKSKTRIIRKSKQMYITGVVVNKKVNIAKKTRRALRAQLHNIILKNEVISLKLYQQLRGKIEWIRSLNQLHGLHLLEDLGKIRYKTL